MTEDEMKRYECDGQMSIFDFMPKEEPEQLPGFRGGKIPPGSTASHIAQIARLEANSSVSKEYIDKTREYYGIPKDGEIIYFVSGVEIYQAKVLKCVEGRGTYIQASANGCDEWQIREWHSTREDAEKAVAKFWNGKIGYHPLPKSERPKKSEQCQQPEIDASHCDGCEYRDTGDYEVDERGYTWKYHCPGTASANWPHGTPMNVSAPIVERDGHYYEDNVVDGIPHIFCWKKKGAKRYFNQFEVKEALEAVIGEMKFEPKVDMWVKEVKDAMFSFEIDRAEYENQSTKEGDDIISVAISMNSHESYGKPCDSIDEAVKCFKFYYDRVAASCQYSKHECNKQELWKVADMTAEESHEIPMCPHVCCRKCTTQGCGARCNGAPEPVIRQWHRLCKHQPETSGYYEIMDIRGVKSKAWYEKNRGFDHVTGYDVECWRILTEDK